jgi:hypothetical protein
MRISSDHDHRPVSQTNDVENPSDENPSHRKRLSFLNQVFSLRVHLKTFNDPEVFQEYKLSKKRYFDIMSIVPTATIFHIALATRYNWSRLPNSASSGSLFLVSDILVIINTVIFLIYFISHLTIHRNPKKEPRGSLYKISDYILLSGFGGRIEDVICLICALHTGFCLLARVYV